MRTKIKILLFGAIVLMATSCGMIKGTTAVSPDYYVTDIDGYQLIFKDTQGKVLNALKSSVMSSSFVTVKRVPKRNGEDWVVTTTLEDAIIAVSYEKVFDLKDADVIKIPLSRVEIYTREVK